MQKFIITGGIDHSFLYKFIWLKIPCFNIIENILKYMTWKITKGNDNSFDMILQMETFLLHEIDSS